MTENVETGCSTSADGERSCKAGTAYCETIPLGGERYKALQAKVAKRMTDANATAISYINDATPGIYSLNRKYAAYLIESVAPDVDFTLWDEQTVR